MSAVLVLALALGVALFLLAALVGQHATDTATIRNLRAHNTALDTKNEQLRDRLRERPNETPAWVGRRPQTYGEHIADALAAVAPRNVVPLRKEETR